MKNEKTLEFIFYLTLEDSLPTSFYVFDVFVRESGYMLIPIKHDQLQSLISHSGQQHIIVLSSISNSREFKIYNEKIRGYLKYILKSKRITYFHLSSFAKSNDQKSFNILKNYFFIKYPVNAKDLIRKICKYHVIKSEMHTIWPGGRKNTTGASSV